MFMPEGSKVAKKTKQVHDLDRIIVRLPEGMREKIADLAAANGRSMTAEVVAALEQHLKGTDRVTLLWELFEKHRENLEAIPQIWGAVEDIEIYLQRSTGESPSGLRTWRLDKEEAERLAKLPPITAEQAVHIRTLINETNAREEWLLRVMRAASIEEIKEYKKAVQHIEDMARPWKNPPA
jgi:hypothetical protein